MGFPRQEYQSVLPCPPPGDLPNPSIEPASPALAGGFFICWAIVGETMNTWDETTGHCIPSKAKKKKKKSFALQLPLFEDWLCEIKSGRKISNFWVAGNIELMEENCFSNPAREAFLFAFHPEVAKCQRWESKTMMDGFTDGLLCLLLCGTPLHKASKHQADWTHTSCPGFYLHQGA